MSVTSLLVLVAFLQLSIRFLFNLLFPSLFELNGFLFFYLAFSTVFSIFLPTFLYLKNENKPYFCNVAKGIPIDKTLFIAAILGIVCQFVGMALNLPVITILTELIGPIESKLPEIATPESLIIALVVMALIPAVCEEILFRGVILNTFREYGTKCAVFFSALMFAMLHMDLTNFIGPFVMGLVFGIIVIKTNRLIYSMIAHFFVNASATMISYSLQFDVFKDFYDDFLLLIMLVSIVLIFILVKLFYNEAEKKELEFFDEYKENVIEINEGESSIRIIEHDIKENNFKLAFQALFKMPSFYLLIALFLVVGGSIFM